MNKKSLFLVFFLVYYSLYSYEFNYLTTFYEHKSSVGCIAFSNNSKYLASGSFDATIKIWDLKIKKSINTIIHGAIVESLAFSVDNKLLASAGRDKCVKIWDVKSGNLIQVSGPFNDFLFCLEFSPDNKNILIGSYKYIFFLDIKNNKTIKKLSVGNIWVRNIKFSPNNNYLGICGSNEVQIYNIKYNNDFISKLFLGDMDLKKISTYKMPSYVYSFAFSGDSQYFAFGDERGDVYLYRTIDGLFMWNKKIYDSLIWSISFSTDNILSIAGRDRDIIMLDIKSSNIINILHGTSDEIYSTAFSSNGKYFASSDKNGKINIWEIKKIYNFYLKEKYFLFILIFIIILLIIKWIYNKQIKKTNI